MQAVLDTTRSDQSAALAEAQLRCATAEAAASEAQQQRATAEAAAAEAREAAQAAAAAHVKQNAELGRRLVCAPAALSHQLLTLLHYQDPQHVALPECDTKRSLCDHPESIRYCLVQDFELLIAVPF